MPAMKNVYLTAPDGEIIFFKSKRDAANFLGCRISTLERAVRNNRKTRTGYTARFENAKWMDRDWVTAISVTFHTNVYLGLKAYGEKHNKAVSVLIREALFEMLPEAYLFEQGRKSDEGLKNVEFKSVGEGMGWRRNRPSHWKQPEEKIDRTK